MQQFKVGDHVIVDEGDYVGDHTADSYDATVLYASDSVSIRSYCPACKGVAVFIVKPAALTKVDDLPEFKVGDRALVVGNTSYPAGIAHYIEVGTDVEVIAGPRPGDPRRLYTVRGKRVGLDRAVQQNISARDLEAEPTYPRRSWWVDNTNATADDFEVIEFSLTPAATIALNETRRAAALTKAVEVLGTHRDIDELTAVADWLLAS